MIYNFKGFSFYDRRLYNNKSLSSEMKINPHYQQCEKFFASIAVGGRERKG